MIYQISNYYILKCNKKVYVKKKILNFKIWYIKFLITIY